MDIECGKCSDFVDQTERDFGQLLDKHGFQPVKCTADRGNRECKLMLESQQLRLLFVRSDEAETCELGSLEAEFPQDGLYGQGDNGWYNVITLLEFKTGKKLLTKRRLKKFLEYKPDYFTWQAQLLSENVGMLFELFGDEKRGSWEDDFLAYYRELVKG